MISNILNIKNITIKFIKKITPKNVKNRLHWLQYGEFVHYHGWDIIMNDLKLNVKYDERIIICSFLDSLKYGSTKERWECDLYMNHPWIGFLHHPVNPEVDRNAIESINWLRKKGYLKKCLGIIVMCQDMKERLREILIEDIPIHVIYHPKYGCKGKWKEFDNEKVLHSIFPQSEQFKNPILLHCGSHLRDDSVFRNVITDNYIKCMWTKKKYEHGCFRHDKKTIDPSMSVMYHYSFRDKKIVGGTIQLYDPLTDYHYEELLKNGTVVLIWLKDAAAVNSVLECIILCVPIIVNRLPALEEVLGKNYPLFVDTEEEIDLIVNGDRKLILDAYEYLCNLDKTIFSFEYFKREFISVLGYHTRAKMLKEVVEEIKFMPPLEEGFECFEGGDKYREHMHDFENKKNNF